MTAFSYSQLCVEKMNTGFQGWPFGAGSEVAILSFMHRPARLKPSLWGIT